jgi:hypothetical protein
LALVPTVRRLKKKLSDKKYITFTHRLHGKNFLANSPVLLVTPLGTEVRIEEKILLLLKKKKKKRKGTTHYFTLFSSIDFFPFAPSPTTTVAPPSGSPTPPSVHP